MGGIKDKIKTLKLKWCALCWKLILNCAWGKEGSEYCFALQIEGKTIIQGCEFAQKQKTLRYFC